MSLLDGVYAVLMIGHSLFGTTGPTMLERALVAGTGEGSVRAQIINGAPLRYNWDQSHSAEGVDARDVLPEGAITHLILTEAIPLANHTQWSDTEVYAQAFAGLAVAANPNTQIYVQETWHSLNSGTGVAVEYDDKAHVPWRTRLDQDLPSWEQIVAGIAAGNRSPTSTVRLIPAGQALGRLHDEIAAQNIPGLQDIAALFDDDIHLNDLGHYFVAMVQYATLTGRDPMGLPVGFKDRWGDRFDTPDPDLARALQRVAWEAVQAYETTGIAPVPLATPAKTKPAAPRAPPALPVADLVQTPEGAVAGTNAVAIGLAEVTDWSPQLPFLDLMKTARPWIGHRPGTWGGMSEEELRTGGYLDAQGWPLRMPPELSSIGTLILTDMPEAAVSLKGRYRLTYSGKGVIEVGGRARNVRYGTGEVSFDYTPGPGSVDLRIQRINTTTPPRITSIIKLDQAERAARGDLFNPQWTARIGGFAALRFMDWMHTNNATPTAWEDRPKPQDATYAKGVPVEIMLALANHLETDAWINVPHPADDTYVRALAEMLRDGLDPGLSVYVEFSNEVWNWQFEQARWADARALARWGEKDKWMQYHGLRAAEVARIWSEVFAGQPEGRLINVISSQTGWLGLEAEVLEAPLAQQEGAAAPAAAFDAYAITGYFGGILGTEERAELVAGWLDDSRAQATSQATADGLSGQAATDYITAHLYDHASALAGRELMDGGLSGIPDDTLSDLLGRVWPYHAAVARKYDLDLIMYEGGSHAVGIGARVDDAELSAFLQHFNYTPEMGRLYDTLLKGWQAVGGQLFNAYSDVYAPVKWGSWGALRHLDDQNPRWDALVGFQ